jgi:hypothetical protein
VVFKGAGFLIFIFSICRWPILVRPFFVRGVFRMGRVAQPLIDFEF